MIFIQFFYKNVNYPLRFDVVVTIASATIYYAGLIHVVDIINDRSVHENIDISFHEPAFHVMGKYNPIQRIYLQSVALIDRQYMHGILWHNAIPPRHEISLHIFLSKSRFEYNKPMYSIHIIPQRNAFVKIFSQKNHGISTSKLECVSKVISRRNYASQSSVAAK